MSMHYAYLTEPHSVNSIRPMSSPSAIDKPGIFESLRLWRDVSASTIKQERNSLPELTPRQMTLLLEVYLNPQAQTVAELSTAFTIPKAAVSRALDVLEQEKLVKRGRHLKDRRKVFIHRTEKGKLLLLAFGETILKHV